MYRLYSQCYVIPYFFLTSIAVACLKDLKNKEKAKEGERDRGREERRKGKREVNGKRRKKLFYFKH